MIRKRSPFAKLMNLWAGRTRLEPHRDTMAYAKIMQNQGGDVTRPMVKQTPINLRYFAKTVYASRAIQAYMRPISMLEWEVVPIDGENSELTKQCETVENCLKNPNNDDSFTTLVQQCVEDILVNGAAAVEQQLGADANRPLWLWPVDTTTIQIFPAWDGDDSKPRYQQSLGYGNVAIGNGKLLRNSELIYMRDRPTTDSPYSYGMLEVAFTSINRLLGVADYAGNLAANATPENLLFFEGMTSDQIRTFRAYWRDEIEGRGMTPVIGGKKAEVIKMRGSDDRALFLEYQTFVIREIAAAFCIAPQNLSLEADVNRNTSETAEDRDWDVAVKPVAKLFESHINRECIQGRLGWHSIRFQFKGLDRDDLDAQSVTLDRYVRAGILTINESREQLGRNPSTSEWGDMVWPDIEIAIAAAKGAATADARNTAKS